MRFSLCFAFSSLLTFSYYGQLETSKHKLLTLLDKSTGTVAREAAKLLSGAFCCRRGKSNCRKVKLQDPEAETVVYGVFGIPCGSSPISTTQPMSRI